MSHVLNVPSPLEEIDDSLWRAKGVKLLVKRDDLISEYMPGNKWRKLRKFVEHAQANNIKTLLSFGGAYSNHLRAVSGAGKLFDFKTIGMVRGEEHKELNFALQFCKDNGMDIYYMDRDTYRNLRDPDIQANLQSRFPGSLFIPDGGHSWQGSLGVVDVVKEIQVPFDHIVCATATGTTLAGLAYGLQEQRARVLGVAVLKGADFLNKDVQSLFGKGEVDVPDNWDINLHYHFGGYAKTKPDLKKFQIWFEQTHSIPLDHVYTAKMFFALYSLLEKDYFKPGQTVVALHTGGFAAVENQTAQKAS